MLLETGAQHSRRACGAYLPRVFIVPLFISEGYFTEEVIPREFGFVRPDPKRSIEPGNSAEPNALLLRPDRHA